MYSLTDKERLRVAYHAGLYQRYEEDDYVFSDYFDEVKTRVSICYKSGRYLDADEDAIRNRQTTSFYDKLLYGLLYEEYEEINELVDDLDPEDYVDDEDDE